MKTISITNRKGGVGKTFVSTNLAYALADKGYCVVVIDADSQGNLSSTFLPSYKNYKGNLHSLLEGTSTLETSIHEIEDNLFLIPSSPNLQFYGANEANVDETKLKFILTSSYLKEVDFVIIDNPPNIDEITLTTLVASDYVIGITEAKGYSMLGIEALFNEVESINKTFNNSLDILGIVVNKFQSKRNSEKYKLNILEITYDDLLFNSVISESTIVLNALEKNMPVLKAFPKSAISVQLNFLVTEILTRI